MVRSFARPEIQNEAVHVRAGFILLKSPKREVMSAALRNPEEKGLPSVPRSSALAWLYNPLPRCLTSSILHHDSSEVSIAKSRSKTRHVLLFLDSPKNSASCPLGWGTSLPRSF